MKILDRLNVNLEKLNRSLKKLTDSDLKFVPQRYKDFSEIFNKSCDIVKEIIKDYENGK